MNHPIRYAYLLAAVPLQLSAQTTEQTEHVDLPTVNVTGQNRTASRDSYTVPVMSTATGLPISPKDTPQSVSVITRKQMDDSGAATLEEALKTTTGLNIYKQGFQTRFQSRGFDIAQISEDGVNSTVCTMCGNNPHDAKQLTDTALYDHIEVVRGATGLRKAQSEPGGSINAIRKRPTAAPLLEFDATADRFGTLRTSADVSGFLSRDNGLRGRAVAVLEKNKSWRKNSDGNKGVIYGVIDKQVGENDMLTLSAMYHREKDVPSLFGLPANPDGSDLRLPRDSYLGANWNRADYKKANIFAEWKHYFGDRWNLTTSVDYRRNKSVTEYGYVPQRQNISPAGTLSDGYTGRSDRNNSQWTVQSDLEGKFDWFGREHEFYAGYEYTKEKFDNMWRGTPLEDGNYPVFSWTGDEIAKPDWNTARNLEIRKTVPDTHTATIATRLNIADKWHILLGTSYSRWRQSQYLSWMKTPDSHYKKGRFIPYAGITYDLTPQQNLYASYTSIFKYSGDYYDINDKLLPPVMGNSYEIGWKGAWNNNKLNSTLALFQTEKHNQPTDTWLGKDPATGNIRPWVRGDRAIYTPVRMESRGIDAEIAGNITDDWQIFAGYTFNKRRYTSTAAAQTAERNGRGVDFSQHTPRHIFRLNTMYRLPGAARKWTVGGGVNVQSKSSPIMVDGEKQYLGGYAVWHAAVQYEPSKHAKLSLKVDNLTDKRYYESYAHRATYQGHFYEQPRNVTLNFKWKM
ncbi:MAG: TonB-dependent siderophore receptor [Neisseria sp.]|nr:TonB-dependent siderophore receptor [Neisseria sp.]